MSDTTNELFTFKFFNILKVFQYSDVQVYLCNTLHAYENIIDTYLIDNFYMIVKMVDYYKPNYFFGYTFLTFNNNSNFYINIKKKNYFSRCSAKEVV